MSPYLKNFSSGSQGANENTQFGTQYSSRPMKINPCHVSYVCLTSLVILGQLQRYLQSFGHAREWPAWELGGFMVGAWSREDGDSPDSVEWANSILRAGWEALPVWIWTTGHQWTITVLGSHILMNVYATHGIQEESYNFYKTTDWDRNVVKPFDLHPSHPYSSTASIFLHSYWTPFLLHFLSPPSHSPGRLGSCFYVNTCVVWW